MLARISKAFREFTPKSVTCWREGYSFDLFRHDLIAGLTVGVIALPLAMAFAIGSGVPPERGLFTAIIAGFLISLLGGSRVQIGGPTGAFVIIVYSIVQRHGYDGLAVATLLAGAMMILMGIAHFGVFLKFIPYPVTTGFTTGIALVIFSSQIKDFLGLSIPHVPADFTEQWGLYASAIHTFNPWALGIGGATLGIIILLRYFFPKIPGAILALILAALAVYFFELPVETIQSKFNGIPRTLPEPCIPTVSWHKIQAVFPDAIAIALLGAIESLLSAVVADGMTGHRHRSNCELVAQGLANMGSILFGGIPATGAIARTTANIRMGAKTPLAGMIHAVTLLLLMLLLAPAAAQIPLTALAAVLIFVAWNMSELDHFYDILKGQLSDASILVITFLLTILIDLTVAVQVGVILAAFLFVKKMSVSTSAKVCQIALENEDTHDSDLILRKDIPEGVTVFEIDGPLFYANADSLNELLTQLTASTKIIILRMSKVPAIDATGIRAIKQFHGKCQQKNRLLLLSGVQEQLLPLLKKTSIASTVGENAIFPHLKEALAFAGKKT